MIEIFDIYNLYNALAHTKRNYRILIVNNNRKNKFSKENFLLTEL